MPTASNILPIYLWVAIGFGWWISSNRPASAAFLRVCPVQYQCCRNNVHIMVVISRNVIKQERRNPRFQLQVQQTTDGTCSQSTCRSCFGHRRSIVGNLLDRSWLVQENMVAAAITHLLAIYATTRGLRADLA